MIPVQAIDPQVHGQVVETSAGPIEFLADGSALVSDEIAGVLSSIPGYLIKWPEPQVPPEGSSAGDSEVVPEDDRSDESPADEPEEHWLEVPQNDQEAFGGSGEPSDAVDAPESFQDENSKGSDDALVPKDPPAKPAGRSRRR